MKPLEYYLRLPWTVQREVHRDDGEYVALTVRELPGFVVASADKKELEREFWVGLRAFLGSYLDAGEEPPVPAGLVTFEATVSYEVARESDRTISEQCPKSYSLPRSLSESREIEAAGSPG